MATCIWVDDLLFKVLRLGWLIEADSESRKHPAALPKNVDYKSLAL
jgi:hypothetical protein